MTRIKSFRDFMVGIFSLCIVSTAIANTCPIRNAYSDPPANWSTDKLFKINRAYPQAMPSNLEQPWKKFDFKTEWKEYMNAVLAYVREGHDSPEVDWYSHKNTKRGWYHALWMDRTESGREFIHGLTRERPPRDGDLLPGVKGNAQSWAVGAYNDVGGYTLGQVFSNPCNPDLNKALFAEGTVSFKLLFTTATPKTLPFLEGTKKWQADIWTTLEQRRDSNGRIIPTKRDIQDVYLLQLDIAVRDNNATETGWVFGTFVYRNDAPGETVFDRMVPVSLQWGNDPKKSPDEVLEETRINPDLAGKNFGWKERPWFGWHGRANGPIDNKESSCLSCHGSAQFPRSTSWGNLISSNPSPPQQKIRDDAHRMAVYFRNIKPGELFDPTTPSAKALDYSLQLQSGMERMCSSFRAGSTRGTNKDLAGLPVPNVCVFQQKIMTSMKQEELRRYLKLTVKGEELDFVSKKNK